MEIEKKELNELESLQESIISKNKEKNESKNTTADDLFGKMVGESLQELPPISKLQARNENRNVLLKYRMAEMQDSLQRKLITFHRVRQGKPCHQTILEIIFKIIFRQILAQTHQVGGIIRYTE